LPTLETWGLQSTATVIEPGERAARKRLRAFLDQRVFDYGNQRNLPGNDGSSRISQDLRWGLLSIREVHAETLRRSKGGDAEQQRNAAIFINELAWREFSFQLLKNFPHVLDSEFQPQFRELPWVAPGSGYKAWCDGETGFPIVDAGMRQLAATGFIHNRVRMIVAMFLCKDLHHSWKHGEQFFMQHLVDGEIAINNTGWQWCASVGTDAQPYFRIQNPWSQTARHDPEGSYIRRWVPELRDVATERLCKVPKAGERLARGYPSPILDHACERDVTLEMFQQAAARFKARQSAPA
jgi:deoxyribodipyrimidine photo-lyase